MQVARRKKKFSFPPVRHSVFLDVAVAAKSAKIGDVHNGRSDYISN